MLSKLTEKLWPPVITLPILVTVKTLPDWVHPTFDVRPLKRMEQEVLGKAWICVGKVTRILPRAWISPGWIKLKV